MAKAWGPEPLSGDFRCLGIRSADSGAILSSRRLSAPHHRGPSRTICALEYPGSERLVTSSQLSWQESGQTGTDWIPIDT